MLCVGGGAALLVSAFTHWVRRGPGSRLRGHDLVDALVALGRDLPGLSSARLTVLWYLVPALGAASWISVGLTGPASRWTRGVAIAAVVVSVLALFAFARLAGWRDLGVGAPLAVAGAARPPGWHLLPASCLILRTVVTRPVTRRSQTREDFVRVRYTQRRVGNARAWSCGRGRVTGLVIVLVAAALLTGIVAWQRRSLVFAGIALLALGGAVWPWAADETPPSRAAAIERAHRAEGAEADACDEYDAAVAAIDEWHRVKGPDDPTALRVAVDQQLAALEGQRPLPTRRLRAAEAQIAVAQQRRFELQSAELQLGELTAKRATSALTEAQRANAYRAGCDTAAARRFDDRGPSARARVARDELGLGTARFSAPRSLQRALRRQQPDARCLAFDLLAGARPLPPIIDRTPAPSDEGRSTSRPKDRGRGRNRRSLRPTQPVPVSTPHSARKRRRHN